MSGIVPTIVPTPSTATLAGDCTRRRNLAR
jgi:hypothetical protein